MLNSRIAFAAFGLAFVASRVLYSLIGVTFNAAPLRFYAQYVDPELLRTDLWQSLFYLKEQPPGYNLFLGSVLQLFPGDSEAAFHAAYVVFGFAMGTALLALLMRLGVRPAIALVTALVFTMNPVAILYENWLFYGYPLSALFVLAAWLLHRYITHGRALDGCAFFGCLAALSTIRTVYHPAWFALTVALLMLARPDWRGRTARYAALPATLLGSIYLKHFLLFGGFVIGGEVFQSLNLAHMATASLPAGAREELERTGRISSVLRMDYYANPEAAYSNLVPAPKKTGIAVLDEPIKSTGGANWNTVWMGRIGLRYREDALTVLRAYPGAYVRHVLWNVPRYFKDAGWSWPFDGQNHPNFGKLEAPLRAHSLLTTGTSLTTGTPWLSALWIPALLAFGAWKGTEGLKHRRSQAESAAQAAAITLFFAVGNIAYSALVTIAFSDSDHNRYRDEVSGLFAVLFGLALNEGWSRLYSRDKTPTPRPLPFAAFLK